MQTSAFGPPTGFETTAKSSFIISQLNLHYKLKFVVEFVFLTKLHSSRGGASKHRSYGDHNKWDLLLFWELIFEKLTGTGTVKGTEVFLPFF